MLALLFLGFRLFTIYRLGEFYYLSALEDFSALLPLNLMIVYLLIGLVLNIISKTRKYGAIGALIGILRTVASCITLLCISIVSSNVLLLINEEIGFGELSGIFYLCLVMYIIIQALLLIILNRTAQEKTR